MVNALWLTSQAWTHPSRVNPYWWVAPTYNHVHVGFRYIAAMCASAGILAGRPVRSPFPIIRLINGTPIEFRSWDDPGNLMGTPIAGGVVDEAGLLSAEAQAAISSRRSATLGPLRYSGNPGSYTGAFRRLCALAEEARTPGSVWAGIYSIYKWTWRDKHEWLKGFNPGAAEQYSRFIDQERESIKPEAEFRRLYEAEWSEDEAAVFRGLREPDGPPLERPEPGHEYVVGVDIGQQVDYLVATVACRDCFKLVAQQRWRGIPYPMCEARLAAMAQFWNAPLIIEENGPGLGVLQSLQNGGVSCFPFTTTGPSKQEIIMNLAVQIEREDRPLRIADLPPTHSELRAFRYQRMPSGNYRYGAPEGEHDDCVMSAAFTVWGLTNVPRWDLSAYGWRS